MDFVFVVRPTRPRFAETVTADERQILAEHFAALKEAYERGTVSFVGRASRGEFAFAVFSAPSLEDARAFAQSDAAVRAGLFAAEVVPFDTLLPARQ